MPIEDLIFQPFEVLCPKCRCRMETSFEDLRSNEEMTCTRCGNVFLPNKDIEALLEMIKAVEEDSLQKSLKEEKQD